MSNKQLQESLKKPPHSKWIGSDESGKGDYFGPLVVAGVVVDDTIVPLLVELGVKDSKRLSDNSVKELAARIKKKCPCSVAFQSYRKYPG